MTIGAMKRSRRSRLNSSGYSQYSMNGSFTFSEEKAKSLVRGFHARGYLAQALQIHDYDYPQSWWIVMYKKGGKND